MALYSDINRRDPLSISLAFDFDAILNSMESAVSQPPRQRLFRPWGSGFTSALFKLDNEVAFSLLNTLKAIVDKDPRVQLVYNQSSITPVDAHTFKVVATFRVPGLRNQTFTRVGFINVKV